MSKPWDESFRTERNWILKDKSLNGLPPYLVATLSYFADTGEPDVDARARLMAAAPELYRALASALYAMRETGDARLHDAVVDAEDALKKARGG